MTASARGRVLVRWLLRAPTQPAGELSAAPYGAGKINNEMEITAAAGSLPSLSPATK